MLLQMKDAPRGTRMRSRAGRWADAGLQDDLWGVWGDNMLNDDLAMPGLAAGS